MMDYGLWIIGIAISGTIFILCFLARKATKAKLIQVFGKREIVPFDEWFELYCSNQTASKELVKDVLISIAKELGIEATQIRPNDSLYHEFALSKFWRHFVIDDPLCIAIERLAKKYSKTQKQLLQKCQTVEDLINVLQKTRSVTNKS